MSAPDVPGINFAGFTVKGNTDKRECTPEGVEACRIFIREYCTDRQTINRKFTSYFLKHVAEKTINGYVSNGEFLKAALLEGYKIQLVPGTISGHINIRVKSDIIDRYCAHSWVNRGGWY